MIISGLVMFCLQLVYKLFMVRHASLIYSELNDRIEFNIVL